MIQAPSQRTGLQQPDLVADKIKEVLHKNFAFTTNLDSLNKKMLYRCNLPNQEYCRLDVEESNSDCNYQSNNLWELRLHKKLFHQDLCQGQEDDKIEFQNMQLKDRKVSQNDLLPNIKQFKEYINMTQIILKIQRTNRTANKRQMKAFNKIIISSSKLNANHVSPTSYHAENSIQNRQSQQPTRAMTSSINQHNKWKTKSQVLPNVRSFSSHSLTDSPSGQPEVGAQAMINQTQAFKKVVASHVVPHMSQIGIPQIAYNQEKLQQKVVYGINAFNANRKDTQATSQEVLDILQSEEQISKVPYMTKDIRHKILASATQDRNESLKRTSALSLQNWLNEIESSSLSDSQKEKEMNVQMNNQANKYVNNKELRQFKEIQSKSQIIANQMQNMIKLDQVLVSQNKIKLKPKQHNTSQKLDQVQQYFEDEMSNKLSDRNREVVCPFNGCDKKFKHKSLLLLHARTHTGDKPFQCQFCEKRFITNGNKKDHERRHLNLKLFECTICHQKFYRSNQLKKHMTQCAKMVASSVTEPAVNPQQSGIHPIFDFKNQILMNDNMKIVQKQEIMK